MALVVLLRGLNVGGHRTFRPTTLAAHLRHLDAVNIGAAGTFVIRQPISHAQLRLEVARRLPFDVAITICRGREIARLISHDFFAGHPARPGIVRFVSVLSRLPRTAPRLPINLPARGKWLLRVLARDDRFVLGLYRRNMKVISYLGALDRIFGVPATTRNWKTITAIARVLDNEGSPAEPARVEHRRNLPAKGPGDARTKWRRRRSGPAAPLEGTCSGYQTGPRPDARPCHSGQANDPAERNRSAVRLGMKR